MSDWTAIVIAAGQGTRMKSAVPKILHPLCGRPMVAWVVEAALEAGASHVTVVLAQGRDDVAAMLAARFGDRVTTAVQDPPRGTGDAVRCGLRTDDLGRVVVLNGDGPLARAEMIRELLVLDSQCGLITGHTDEPRGYGRIVRDSEERVTAIREDRDCSPEERAIREWNPGVYVFDVEFLKKGLSELRAANAQGELYLTDLVARAAAQGTVGSVVWPDEHDLHGVNDRSELARAEAILRARILRTHMLAGVTVRDPSSTYVEADVVLGADTVLEPGVVLRGATKIGSGVRVDVGCVLTDVEVADGAVLKPYTVATDSTIGEGAQLGPFSHLRPKTKLGRETHIGNFVETKATTMGARSKANHLAYLGDGRVGEDVNVGAGTIFCNYDGVQKHVTTLEDGAFIGSDSQLVAPVTVGKGAYVATGTTVTKDVPADALAIGRAKQENKAGYASRLRVTMKAKKDAKK